MNAEHRIDAEQTIETGRKADADVAHEAAAAPVAASEEPAAGVNGDICAAGVDMDDDPFLEPNLEFRLPGSAEEDDAELETAKAEMAAEEVEAAEAEAEDAGVEAEPVEAEAVEPCAETCAEDEGTETGDEDAYADPDAEHDCAGAEDFRTEHGDEDAHADLDDEYERVEAVAEDAEPETDIEEALAGTAVGEADAETEAAEEAPVENETADEGAYVDMVSEDAPATEETEVRPDGAAMQAPAGMPEDEAFPELAVSDEPEAAETSAHGSGAPVGRVPGDEAKPDQNTAQPDTALTVAAPAAVAKPRPAAAGPVDTGLLRHGLAELDDFVADMTAIDRAMETVAGLGDRSAGKHTRKLQRQLRKFEPSVTMIGQVKAGKTSLVNAMVGWPDLLPADVNPWTSVVTSIHISPKPHLEGDHASFRFFEEDEWTRLLERGGRIGELAGRAGAEDELQKVTAQLEAMREKSRRRLGNRFEMLMGQEHAYGYFDSELINRYVCLGDDFETDTETSSSQGRFADITKSADLFLHRKEFPVEFCIRDTPGVNDTFMMREQITIRAIRESRMCVVVLSAHQALSTVDMALIRLISNLPSREVIIFVNRIDELGDPARQVPEIRDSIRKTLQKHQGPADAEIVFGSAYWANHILNCARDPLEDASQDALFNWAEHELSDDEADISPEAMIWKLSGVPRLLATISDRVATGAGREALSKTAKAAMNVVNGVTAGEHIVSMRKSDGTVKPLDRKALPVELDRIEKEAREALEQEFGEVVQNFYSRLDRSHKSFLERATAALIRNLERYGETEVWQYDATGLRVLLRSSFQVFSRNAQGSCKNVFLDTTAKVRELYLRAFNVPDASFRLEAPSAPYVQPPVMLGQTIALDMSSNWWGRWWRRRRGYGSFATDFAQIIRAETDPIVEGLKAEHVNTVLTDAKKVLSEFMDGQREVLFELAERASTTVDDLQGVGSSQATRNKVEALEESRAVLERFIQ